MTWTIYALTDPRTSEVRYVGKTITPKKRIYHHVWDAMNANDHTHKSNWIRALVEAGTLPVMSVLETGDGDWQTAERQWIKRFKDAGSNLTNATDGGEGQSSTYRASAETKAKMSKALKGQKRTAEAKSKMSAWQIGRKPSEACLAAAGKSCIDRKPHLGCHHNEEARAKIRAARAKQVFSPEAIEKRSVAMKAAWIRRKANGFIGVRPSVETRAKMSASQKLRQISYQHVLMENAQPQQ